MWRGWESSRTNIFYWQNCLIDNMNLIVAIVRFRLQHQDAKITCEVICWTRVGILVNIRWWRQQCQISYHIGWSALIGLIKLVISLYGHVASFSTDLPHRSRIRWIVLSCVVSSMVTTITASVIWVGAIRSCIFRWSLLLWIFSITGLSIIANGDIHWAN